MASEFCSTQIVLFELVGPFDLDACGLVNNKTTSLSSNGQVNL